MRNVYNIFIGKSEGKIHSEDLCVYRKIILKWVVEKEGGKLRTGFIWLGIGASGGPL
jgi:hypothetical protein